MNLYRILLVLLSWGMTTVLYAQDLPLENEVLEDTLTIQIPRELDYSYLKDSVGLKINAPDSLDAAMLHHISRNMQKKSDVYRLRIFFDNSRNARAVSENIKNEFTEKYRDIPFYRIYDNPYWKVTVGDFREKSDAMKLMDLLKKEYPSIFLVKETLSTI